MKKKKLFLSVLVMILFVSLSINVFGTKPLGKEDPTMIFDVIPVEDTDVYVNNVRHVFDFANEEFGENNYENKTLVTSTYKLINPGEAKSLKVALPIYIGHNNRDSSIDIDMIANNKSIKSKLYFNYDVDYFEVQDIVTNFDLNEMIAEDFRISDEKMGKLYVFTSEQETSAIIRHSNQDKAFYTGFNMQERESWDESGKRNVRLYNTNKKTDEDIWLFTNSEDIEVKAGYGTNLLVYDISFNDIIERYIDSFEKEPEEMERGKIAGINWTFLNYFENESLNGVFEIENLDYNTDHKFLAFMVYDVELLGLSSQNEISISYFTASGIDEGYNPSTFSMVYLPKFASKWPEFNNLELRIFPSAYNKYIASSSHKFTKTYEDAFMFSMNEVKEDDITFSMSSSSQPKKVNFNGAWIIIVLILVLPIILILVIIAGIAYALTAKKRKTEYWL